MPEPTQADMQAAFDLTTTYDCEFGSAASVKKIAQAIAAAREEGRSEYQTATEHMICDEPREIAKVLTGYQIEAAKAGYVEGAKAERERVVEKLRVWAVSDTGDCIHCSYSDLLAQLDEIEKEGTQP